MSATTDQAPPLTATLAQIAGAEDFSLKTFRKARDGDAPATPPAEPPAQTPAPPAPAAEAKPVDKPAEPPKVEEPPKPDASEAGRALAQHKSGLEKRKASIQDEIDRLTHDKHATRREVEAARAELDQVKREIAEAKGQATPKVAPVAAADPDDPEPKEEDFEKYADYVKATGRWAARQEHKAVQKAEETSRAQQSQAAALEHVSAQGRTVHPDFDDVLEEALARGDRWSPMMTAVVFREFFQDAHHIAYALAKDAALTRELLALRSPIQVGIRLRDLVSGLTAAPRSGPAVEPPSKSQAQEPPKPVGAAPTASGMSPEAVVGTGTEISLKRLRAAREARR